MESIANFAVVEHRASITKYANAVSVRPSPFYGAKLVQMKNLRGCSDSGSIKGLSANTLSRLREAIARTCHKDGEYRVYGVCLTIPWGDDGELSQAQCRAIWERFVKNASRVFDSIGLGAIFRVELQERKAVHWHLMVYLPKSLDEQRVLRLIVRRCKSLPKGCSPFPTGKGRDKDTGRLVDIVRVGKGGRGHFYAVSLLRLMWANACWSYHEDYSLAMEVLADSHLHTPAVCGCLPVSTPSDIVSWDYCCHCKPLHGVKGAMGYLASHTAKHKQEQLGYIGKQWGYLGKSNLVSDRGVLIPSFGDLTEKQRVVAFRSIRTWCRKNRPKSAWFKVRTRMVKRGVYKFFTGLSVLNHRKLYLFDIPDIVFQKSIEGAKA